MRNKTFLEMTTEIENLYPSQVDEATKNAINEWFRFRCVSDNERFPVYFRRVLNRDYTRYRQLLRIEAGKQGDNGTITNFDWLVTDYLERYEKRDTTHETEGTQTVSNELTRSGNMNVTNSGTTGTATTTNGSFTAGQKTTNSSTSNGSTSGTTKENSGSQSEARTGSLARTQPMSAEYSDNDLSDGTGRDNILMRTGNEGNYSYIAGESQSGFAEDKIIGLKRNFPDLKIKNPTTSSDTHTSNGTLSQNDSETSGTTTDTTSGSIQHSGTDTTTGSNNTTVTHGLKVGTTQSGTETGATEGTTTNSETGSDKIKTQHTGRGGEIAEILKNAQEYIKQSSAFDWLRGQLETCFIANLDY